MKVIILLLMLSMNISFANKNYKSISDIIESFNEVIEQWESGDTNIVITPTLIEVDHKNMLSFQGYGEIDAKEVAHIAKIIKQSKEIVLSGNFESGTFFNLYFLTDNKKFFNGKWLCRFSEKKVVVMFQLLDDYVYIGLPEESSMLIRRAIVHQLEKDYLRTK